jgi:hypothetical protein
MNGLPFDDAAASTWTGRLCPTGADIARCGFTFPGAAISSGTAGNTTGAGSDSRFAVDSQSVPGSGPAYHADQRFDAKSYGVDDAKRAARRGKCATNVDWT